MELNVGKLKLTFGSKPMVAKDTPQRDEEKGVTGTSVFAGLLYETEYNKDLQGEAGLKVYDKMRRSDGQVKAGLLACKLPLQVARWDVVPATQDQLDVDVAHAVKDNLFNTMDITWDEFLRHTLLMLDYGHMVFEKVWELKDGKYRWKKLAPRLPLSITEWHVTDEGDLDFIKQQVQKKDRFSFVDIPAEKLLVFTHEKEGADFRGISLLRAAYKHWYYKNNLYAIDGIAAERHGVGFASFTFPDNATEEQKNYVKEVGKSLYTHESAYAALPESIKFALLGVQGQLHDIKGSIEHHDLQIVRSILAQFMNLGAKSVGSFALSNDQSRFFLMALQAVGRNICDIMNRFAIRQYVDYNWDTHGRYPKLDVSGLDDPDLVAFATAISQLMTSQAITRDDATENELRRLYKLPKKVVTTPTALPSPPGAPKQESVKPPPAQGEVVTEDKLNAAAKAKGSLVAVEHSMDNPRGPESVVAFNDITKELDSAEQRLVKAVLPVQAKQVKTVVSTIAGYMRDGAYDRIAEIDVPYRDKVAAAIEQVFGEMVDYGAKQVRDERAKAGRTLKATDLPKKESRESLLHVRALAMANILASKLRAAVSYEAISQVRKGDLDTAALAAVMVSLSTSDLEDMASFSVSEAFNTGREEQAAEYADEIEEVYSSALMDDNTCPFCNSMDGKTWKYGDQPAEPPYEECEGRDHCRCIFVYVYKSEVK